MTDLDRRTLLAGMAAVPLLGAASTAATAAPLATGEVLSWSPMPAVFFVPHQDDELLSMGSGIMEHVLAGREVHVIVVGKGDGTIVRTRDMPSLLGYVPTGFHIGSVRDREFRCTVEMLGARPHVPDFHEREPEREFDVDRVYTLMANWLAKFPGADVKTHSPFGSNADHRACGEAVERLWQDGVIQHEPRYYVSPWDRGVVDLPRVRRVVCDLPYGIQHFYRKVDLKWERWGVGYKSVPRYFRVHAKDRSSYWHA